MTTSSFDTSPQEALRTIDAHQGPVLIDLDETLYLRNSTEDFLDSAWPGPLAFLLVRAVELLKPWRLTGGSRTRDVWRVLVILTLMPWSLWTWRRAARRLGVEARNGELVAALDACRQPKIIVTLGFGPIVAPLISAIGVRDPRVVSMSPWRFRDRLGGKRALVARALGEPQLCNALLITDSLDDQDLLECCMRPLRVIWPVARFCPAFQRVYLPGLYTSRVKRPNSRFIYRSIISDDFSIWVLASLPLVTQPVLHVAGLLLLLISFWAIYETGYVDNDRIGARYEEDPVLTQQFFQREMQSETVLPWVWAAVFGVGALLLLRWPAAPVAEDLLAWTAVLLTTHFAFRLYNRLDKRTRIWPYAGLQWLRALSFTAVVGVTVVGAVALVAHVLARWVPYYTYRITRTKYCDDEIGTIRLLFFVLICFAVYLVMGTAPFTTPTAALLLLWFAFKARRELLRSARNVHLITKKRKPQPDGRQARAVEP